MMWRPAASNEGPKETNDQVNKLLLRIRTNNMLALVNYKLGLMPHDEDSEARADRQRREGELMQHFFLKRRIQDLSRDLTDHKITEHLVTHNTVTLIGRLASDLPKPTESPSKIWKALLVTATPQLSL